MSTRRWFQLCGTTVWIASVRRWPLDSSNQSLEFGPSGNVSQPFADVRPGEPGRDLAVAARIHREDDAAVRHRSANTDQPRPFEQMELPSRRGAAKPDFLRQARRCPRSERDRRDQPTPRRVSEELDPLAVLLGHRGPAILHPVVGRAHTRPGRPTDAHSRLISGFRTRPIAPAPPLVDLRFARAPRPEKQPAVREALLVAIVSLG